MDTAQLKEELITGIQAEKNLNRNLLKQYYKSNFYAFGKDILGWDFYEPLHKPLCNFVIDNVKRKQLLIELPRGSFKSSTITVGYSVWQIVNNPNVRILIVNATYEMIKKFVSQIQDHLKKNPKILEIYGDLTKDAPIWNESTIKLRTENSFEIREPTLLGYGMTGNLVSTHFDIILLDDLVNWDNTTTLEQIDKVKSFYKSTLDLLEPFGELIIIGTPYHFGDLYAWIEDEDEAIHKNFAIFKKPAYTGDWGEGDLLFPERLGWERLGQLKRTQGPRHFATQYMLRPILDEDAVFKYDFRYYEETDLKGIELLHYMAIDPAFSQNRDADKTAFIVVGVDRDNNWYILDIYAKRLSPKETIDMIVNMNQKWHPRVIAIETVAWQKAVAQFMVDEIKQRRISPLPIKFVKPETSRSTGLSVPKQYRIESLEPRYASGQIFHNKNLSQNDELEEQLRNFPRNDHDDIIDALAYIEQIANVPRGMGSGQEGDDGWNDNSRSRGRGGYLY